MDKGKIHFRCRDDSQLGLAFAEIESNQKQANLFKQELINYTHSSTRELLAITIEREPHTKLNCAKCQVHDIEIKDKLVECRDPNCNWRQWRNIYGVNLSIKDIELLISKGKTTLLKGLKK